MGAIPARAQRDGKLEGKPQLSLILEFRRALENGSFALQEGVEKYGRNNWANGMPIVEVVDSLMRHLTAFMSGEMIDEKSGLPHADKVFTNALMLSEYYHMREEGLLVEILNDVVPLPAVGGAEGA